MFLKKTGPALGLLAVFFFCSSYLTEGHLPPSIPLTEVAGDVAYQPLNLPQKNPRIDSLFLALQRYQGFTGVVLMAEKGEITHSGAYGFSHYRKKTALSIETPFQLASVSKSLTAALIMRLYEEGLLDLDEKVQTYIPDFPYSEITLRHLLNQRSGLCRYMYLADKYWDQERPVTNEDVLCLFQTYTPDLYFTPGQRFNYINTNYTFLALVAERLTGKSFSVLMQERVFKPLGMTHSTAFSLAEASGVEGAATGHRRYRRGGYRAVPYDYLDGVGGDKGIYCSARDLFLFDQALYGNRFLRKETVAQAFLPGSPELRTHNYGFGWRMKTKVDGLVYHFGWWRGFRTCFMRDMVNQRTLIILSNSDHARGLLGFWGLNNLLNGNAAEEKECPKAEPEEPVEDELSLGDQES